MAAFIVRVSVETIRAPMIVNICVSHKSALNRYRYKSAHCTQTHTTRGNAERAVPPEDVKMQGLNRAAVIESRTGHADIERGTRHQSRQIKLNSLT